MTAEPVDVLVIGAGPAGAAAAIAARRLDGSARVVLVDRADFPRDKPCGDAVAWHALQELAHLGLPHLVDDHPASTTITITGPGGSTWTSPLPRAGRVVPRRTLDGRLVAAAEAAGVQRVVHRVRRVNPDGERVDVDGRWAARGVVGADGTASTVRRELGLGTNRGRHRAVAVRGYVDVAPGDATQHIELTDDAGWPAYRWRFGVGDGTANVGFGTLDSALTAGRRQLDRGLAGFADGGAVRARRAAPMALSTSRPAAGRGRVLLAGDAAALVNPLSGEGIFQALVSGRLAAEALAADAARGASAASAYSSALRAELGRAWRATTLSARALASPRLVDGGVRCVAAGGTGDDLVELAIGRGGLTWRLARDAARALTGLVA